MDIVGKKEILGKLPGKIVILGYGSVGQAILPLILRHIECKSIKVVEANNHATYIAKMFPEVDYEVLEVTKDNFEDFMSNNFSAGDFCIDVSLNIDCLDIITWCLANNVFYMNTSLERWPDEPDETIPNLADRTLYKEHQKMRKATRAFKGHATSLVTNGANPGLVTYFTKAALLDIAKACNIKASPKTQQEWAELAKILEVKTVHISERDTQVLREPKLKGEFVNTWSCEGFWAEGRAPAEMGWGTHELPEPENGEVQKDDGPCNGAFLHAPGVSVLVKTWAPLAGSFNGFLVQHSEAITVSEYLTTEDKSYRPTVHYAYQPSDAAIVSIHEMRGAELTLQHKKRIAKNSIVSGVDELGVLLLGHKKNAWWYGSQLSIEEARDLIPYESATSVQVAASLLAGFLYILENPTEGYIEPESVDHEFMLNIAKRYLGPIASVQSDWTPLQDRNKLYSRDLDPSHPWRLENFRIAS